MTDSVRTPFQREFDEYKLTSELPEVLLVYVHPHIGGAMDLSNGFSSLKPTGIDTERWVMSPVWFTTPNVIHGLLHRKGPNQIFFMGYKCERCNHIFLVPEIKSVDELGEKMRHGCHV